MMTHKEDDYGDDDDNDEDVDDDENYQNGHNSANFQARTSKVYMVVDLDNTYTLYHKMPNHTKYSQQTVRGY